MTDLEFRALLGCLKEANERGKRIEILLTELKETQERNYSVFGDGSYPNCRPATFVEALFSGRGSVDDGKETSKKANAECDCAEI